jgi:hypothetical protein
LTHPISRADELTTKKNTLARRFKDVMDYVNPRSVENAIRSLEYLALRPGDRPLTPTPHVQSVPLTTAPALEFSNPAKRVKNKGQRTKRRNNIGSKPDKVLFRRRKRKPNRGSVKKELQFNEELISPDVISIE